MSNKHEVRKRGCTFQWKIENFTYCWHKKGEYLYSPVFFADMKEETTKWKLVLCPKEHSNPRFVSFCLYRTEDDSSEATIEVNYDLSFLSADHLNPRPLYSKSFRGTYYKGRIAGDLKFMNREDLFTQKRTSLMPQNALTVQCNMWRTDGENIACDQILARTLIQIEKGNFTWAIKEFSSLEPNKKYPYTLKSFSKNELATLKLSLTGQCGNETICIEIIYLDKNVKRFEVQSCILDERGESIDATRQEYCFDVFSNSDKYTLLLTKRKLIEMKKHFLPKDILTLKFECTASIGIAFQGIEQVHLGPNSIVENSMDQRKFPELTLKDDLKSICCEGFLADVILRTATDTFPVHKIILSARSPVFMSMFSTDMKEKYENCVDITDMDSGTLRRLILYIYSDTVDDLNMENAFQLYEAADKYSVLTLKNKCANFLKDNLDPSNACQILVVADLHNDEDLKSAVQDYILEHDYKVLNSKEWKQLMESNLKLTSETMIRKFVESKN